MTKLLIKCRNCGDNVYLPVKPNENYYFVNYNAIFLEIYPDIHSEIKYGECFRAMKFERPSKGANYIDSNYTFMVINEFNLRRKSPINVLLEDRISFINHKK